MLTTNFGDLQLQTAVAISKQRRDYTTNVTDGLTTRSVILMVVNILKTDGWKALAIPFRVDNFNGR